VINWGQRDAAATALNSRVKLSFTSGQRLLIQKRSVGHQLQQLIVQARGMTQRRSVHLQPVQIGQPFDLRPQLPLLGQTEQAAQSSPRLPLGLALAVQQSQRDAGSGIDQRRIGSDDKRPAP
jgi:hypothetical protein